MRELTPLLALPVADEPTDRQFVTALARGLEVLRVFRPGEALLGNADIATRTGLPKPTISRLTYTLTRLGYLEYLPKLEKYRLGAPVLALGYAFLANTDVREIARPLMQDLAEQTSSMVSLASRDRLSMIYREVRHGNSSTGLRLDVGSRVPIARSAAGMAALAVMAKNEREHLIEALREQMGDEWPQIAEQIERTGAEIAERGFCAIRRGVFTDSNAVGAPFVSPDGSSILGFALAGPDFLVPEAELYTRLGPMLADMVVRLNGEMARRIY